MPRILYVEDNDDNIYMLRSRLQRQGFEVLIARDGASGVEIARSERPDLILMDLGLPILDGDQRNSRYCSFRSRHVGRPCAGAGCRLRRV